MPSPCIYHKENFLHANTIQIHVNTRRVLSKTVEKDESRNSNIGSLKLMIPSSSCVARRCMFGILGVN